MAASIPRMGVPTLAIIKKKDGRYSSYTGSQRPTTPCRACTHCAGLRANPAWSINDLGQIVANASDNRIYVLTPTKTLD